MCKHGKEKRHVWRMLHLAVDDQTHEMSAAEVSLENVVDNEALLTLLSPLTANYASGINR